MNIDNIIESANCHYIETSYHYMGGFFRLGVLLDLLPLSLIDMLHANGRRFDC